jgi:hypothetical protein
LFNEPSRYSGQKKETAMLMTADVEILDMLYHAKAEQDAVAEERAVMEQGTALLVINCALYYSVC